MQRKLINLNLFDNNKINMLNNEIISVYKATRSATLKIKNIYIIILK